MTPRDPREGGFRPGKRIRIIDFRRNIVPMLELADLPNGADKELKNAVARANQHRVGVQLQQAVLASAAGLVLLELWNVARGRSLLSVKDVAGQVIVVGFAAVAGMAVGAALAKTRARAALVACLRRRICASCGYSLQALAAAGDGCIVCPECGAAWKLKH